MEHEAKMAMKEGQSLAWFTRFAFKNQLPNVPRIDQLELIGKLAQGHK